MSNNPPGIDLPNYRKQGQSPIDLMRPGNGTPWEDRGTSGAIPAYFKTVAKSFTSPGLLMDHISRPDSNRDARAFALFSAAIWGVGILVWNVYWLYRVMPFIQGPDGRLLYFAEPSSTGMFFVAALVHAALVMTGVFLWLTVGMRLYVALAGSEVKGTATSLIYNCFAYCLGPSILALIPFAAPWPWVIAACWIHFDLVVAGKRRLYLKGSSAVVNVVLIGLCVLGITIVVYYIGHWVWTHNPDMIGLEPRPEPVKVIQQ